MPAFNSRIAPKEIAGLPASLFYYGVPALVSAGIAIFPAWPTRLVFIPAAVILAGLALYNTINHKDALLMRAKRLSRHEADAYTDESLQSL